MLPRWKSLIAVALAAAALVPNIAAPARAMAVCTVKSIGVHSEIGEIVLVEGLYKGPADAVDVQLVCGVTRDGVVVARVTDKLTGPVAALAEVRGIPLSFGYLSTCYEATVTHLDGSVTVTDTCP